MKRTTGSRSRDQGAPGGLRAKVLLILSVDTLDRARVLAGQATTSLKLPVSLQIVLRALIEEGLKRDRDPAFVANVERQATAVREARRAARRTNAATTRHAPGVGRRR